MDWEQILKMPAAWRSGWLHHGMGTPFGDGERMWREWQKRWESGEDGFIGLTLRDRDRMWQEWQNGWKARQSQYGDFFGEFSDEYSRDVWKSQIMINP